jgi:hypothetical protein
MELHPGPGHFPPSAQPQWFPGDPFSIPPIFELGQKVDELISKYNTVKQTNRDLKRQIERQEKEKLLLSHPEFFAAEWEKLVLMAGIYRKTLEDLEQRAERTLAEMETASASSLS